MLTNLKQKPRVSSTAAWPGIRKYKVFFSCVLMFSFLHLVAQGRSPAFSITIKDLNFEQAIEKIKASTGYDFFYVKNHIKSAHPVSMSLKDASITTVLNQLLKNQPLTYEINEGVIVLKQKTAVQSVSQANLMNERMQTTVAGSVQDESGTPLAGATIQVKGTSQGTSSGDGGRFQLAVTEGDVLVVTLLGYESQEVTYQGQQTLTIRMLSATDALEEVVVIGYGAVKQRNVTGAVAKIDNEDLDNSVASNFQQMLQGKAAGLQVTQPTGQPGAGVAVQIRSNPSFANAGVLYVIDGVPVNDNAGQPILSSGGVGGKYQGAGVDKSPMNFINPNDIESIEVLKDASAASIYGARAGAGVVLITTKKGKDGKSSLQYSGSYGAQQADKMYPVFGVQEYMEQRNLLRLERWYRDNQIAPYYGTVDAEAVAPYTPVFSPQEMSAMPNRQSATDAIVRGGYTQQHNLSLSGGNAKTTYFASGNFFDQRGVIVGTDYKRYNGRLNLDHQLSEKIKLGTNIIVSNSLANNTITGGDFENGGIITSAIYWAPTVPLRDEAGNYPLSPYYSAIPNPLSYTTNTDLTNGKRVLTAAYGEWSILEELKAKASFSYDQSYSKRSSYFPKTFLYGAQVGGAANLTEADHQTKLFEYTLNYNKELSEKHQLGALVGYSYQQTTWNQFRAGNQNFLSDGSSYYDLEAGQADKPFVGSGKTERTWASYFGRVIYTYNGNITLQASVRRDGASVFADNKKWGMFPGFSAGWILSDESWLQDVRQLSFLKLRAGYGETGNSEFESAAFALYNTDQSAFFGEGTLNSGLVLSRAANPNLTWETAGELNVGLDFGLFNQRINGSVDYYNKTIRNLIAWIPYPSGFIIDGVYGNAGKTRSTGYEINVESQNIRPSSPGGFEWSTTVNFSHYRNYWVERSPEALRVLARYEVATGRDALFNPYFGYLSDGVFTGQYGEAPSHMPNLLPGGIIVKDIHGYNDEGDLVGPDGQITDADRTYIGNQDPKFSFGLGNTFRYKDFDLSIFLSGLKQKKWSPLLSGRVYESTMDAYGFNAMPSSANRWSVNNPNGRFPTSLYDETYSGYQSASNYWLADATFLRARNITLGYTLPERLMNRQKLFANVRLSFDAQNLFTITNYPGLDPELNGDNFYPLVKSFVFGINANF